MDSSTATAKSNGKPPAEHIDLVASLRREWFKLPLLVMQDAGPAVQTFAGILKISNKETFVPVSTIASRSRLPLRTCRKHLVTLAAHGWITNAGRERTRRGAPRRTCTIRLTAKAKGAIEAGYGVLPWWASCRFSGELSWSAKAVLAMVMARLMGLAGGIEDQDGHGLDAADVWSSIENMGGEDRFRFSLDSLQRDTGLSRESIVNAKRELARRKIVSWQGVTRGEGSDTPDTLYPSETFLVTVTPASEGGCYVKF